MVQDARQPSGWRRLPDERALLFCDTLKAGRGVVCLWDG